MEKKEVGFQPYKNPQRSLSPLAAELQEHLARKKLVKRPKKKTKHYDVITYEKRIELLDLIIQKKETIKAAANKLGIKLCTAKHILYLYKNHGKIHQRKTDLEFSEEQVEKEQNIQINQKTQNYRSSNEETKKGSETDHHNSESSENYSLHNTPQVNYSLNSFPEFTIESLTQQPRFQLFLMPTNLSGLMAALLFQNSQNIISENLNK